MHQCRPDTTQVYQLGRAFTTLFLDDTTVNVARRHALQLIHLEQRLHLFVELPVQAWFLERPNLMHWTNRTYSFIHIPGTILFLIVMYYISTTRPRKNLQKTSTKGASPTRLHRTVGRLNPDMYERRRRTMAMCNLLAFIIFTAWPCMPPRLLGDPTYEGPDAPEALSYGFVDTVHSKDGESSVWTTNRFCNQYAAMPSLHFGYSFLIGLTVATLPIETPRRLSWKRISLVVGGMIYPAIILSAIVATANHFVLDAVAGAIVCITAWHANGFLLNLLAMEDWFLWVVRIHKPSKALVDSKGVPLRL
ncbi:putative integral membrane protein [Phaeoacremonium minimum UCRPA7]|uniref:Putative integral membrane protein n=1 Tax=Phaeoacremonium minimum (strain UCR-PA7) TaxID=1286976 RepID=R8BEZ5_PHAM7|nr:putative integral membrane protein [Phaeoacremonium minimum UCRPA7]EON97873.1 putative integral membrane protein [Phaeoacremonium minimum UCRPA7]